MKTFISVAVCMMAVMFLAGFYSHSALAQQSSAAGQSADKLPPDIRPDTLSRMPRAKRNDFTTEEDKQTYDRMMKRVPKLLIGRWLGPTGTRMQVPDVAEIYNEQLAMIKKKIGFEDKYVELTVLVATRESGGKDEWLDHVPDGTKLLGPKIVDVVRNRQDTDGVEEKAATIIQFGRELFNKPIVSSKIFANAERLFGRKDTLLMTLIMCYYSQSAVLMRAYDQHTDTSPQCVQAHLGCDLGKKELSGTW